MNSPTVSVIIPAYNATCFIHGALASLQAQTFEDFETLVIDDGSTDGTVDLVTSTYPSARCLQIQHGGPARARNAGIRESRGEFIAFLDADDSWLPRKLEKQVAAMRQDPAIGMSFTEHSVYNEAGLIVGRIRKNNRLMKGDLVCNIFSRSYVGTSTVMVRRSVLDAVGGFEEGLICGEDDNLWMRIAVNWRVHLIDEPLVRCLARSTSLSRTGKTLFAGVKAHLALLEAKYPALRTRLGPLVRQKHSVLHFERGLRFLAVDQRAMARTEFATAFRYWHGNPRAFLYWLATFLPLSTYPVLRTVNRFFRRRLPPLSP